MNNIFIFRYYLPINNLEGIQIDMLRQFKWMLKDTLEDFNKMISRLDKMSIQINQIIDLLKAGVKAGITYHNYSMVVLLNENL